MHPNAHLWDNGNDPVNELKNVMKVRSKALSQFGQNNIRKGTPMAMLEDVFVPIYLFHRYQIEALKVVGGLLFLCRKGDGQMITRSVTKEEQLNALNAITDCIDPKVLEISENVLKLIPPRPAGYDYNRII
jgi:hypothetical protein